MYLGSHRLENDLKIEEDSKKYNLSCSGNHCNVLKNFELNVEIIELHEPYPAKVLDNSKTVLDPVIQDTVENFACSFIGCLLNVFKILSGIPLVLNRMELYQA